MVAGETFRSESDGDVRRPDRLRGLDVLPNDRSEDRGFAFVEHGLTPLATQATQRSPSAIVRGVATEDGRGSARARSGHGLGRHRARPGQVGTRRRRSPEAGLRSAPAHDGAAGHRDAGEHDQPAVGDRPAGAEVVADPSRDRPADRRRTEEAPWPGGPGPGPACRRAPGAGGSRWSRRCSPRRPSPAGRPARTATPRFGATAISVENTPRTVSAPSIARVADVALRGDHQRPR